MEEVGGFLQGERDYINLAGGTGPLVYERILRCIKFIIFLLGTLLALCIYIQFCIFMKMCVGGSVGRGKENKNEIDKKKKINKTFTI